MALDKEKGLMTAC